MMTVPEIMAGRFATQQEFADALSTSQQLVSYWARKGRILPAEYVLTTEKVTGISRHKLRPDLYPREAAA